MSSCLPNFLQLIYLLLMSVFDIDPQEGKPQDDAHRGSNTEDGVHSGVDSGLFDPLISPVFGRFSPVAWPGDCVTSLHVEGPGDS